MSNVSPMKRLILIFLALFSSSVFSADESNWVVKVQDYEGYPLFTRYPENLNYNKLKNLYPTRLIVDLTFAKIKENGLPANGYNESLEDFDSFVVEYFMENSMGICVLVETYYGKRHFYSYVSNTADVDAFKRVLLKKFPQHEFEMEIKSDKNWSFIRKYSKGFLKNG